MVRRSKVYFIEINFMKIVFSKTAVISLTMSVVPTPALLKLAIKTHFMCCQCIKIYSFLFIIVTFC